MYVIIAYDIGIKRVNKVKSYLRTQLTWVQNSLFEGEISESKYLNLEAKLAGIIKLQEDSITIYKFLNKNLFVRTDKGIKKGSAEDKIL